MSESDAEFGRSPECRSDQGCCWRTDRDADACWRAPERNWVGDRRNAPGVLVIDDDPAILRYVGRCLAHAGFWVCEESSGAAGIEAAIRCRPDVIVCDVTMPGVDGHDVLRAVRATPASREIPFIFLTAKQERRDVRLGMQLGADDYLPKPFSIEELVDAVRSRLDRKWQMVEAQSIRIRDMAQRIDANPLRGRDDSGRLRMLELPAFEEALRRAAEAVPATDMPLAVLRWKDADRIYQEFGPATGEELQRQFDQRLVDVVGGRGDVVAFGRAGLQRIGVLFAADVGSAAAEAGATQLLAEMAKPYRIEGREVFAQFCAGFAHGGSASSSTVPAERAAVVQRQAEAALRFARPLAGSRLVVHEPGSMVVPVDRTRLDADLHYAVERGQLRIHFQPQVELSTGEVIGFESLLRWQHPELGMVSPAEFIPLAEHNGSIRAIGEWVLRESCRQMASWVRQGAPLRHVSVNVSPVQMEDGLADTVRDALRASGLPASCLQLEITETAVLEDLPRAVRILQSLRDAGVTIAIDDFGVGYSSLCYLRQLKFDVLKIDRSFVQDLEQEMEKVAICEMILNLAQLLRFEVVAEGIETQRAKELLTAQGCRYGQGYFFARPLPQEVVTGALWARASALPAAPGAARRPLTYESLTEALRLPVMVGKRQAALSDRRARPEAERQMPA